MPYYRILAYDLASGQAFRTESGEWVTAVEVTHHLHTAEVEIDTDDGMFLVPDYQLVTVR